MPRRLRHCPGGIAYHVMNRAAGRLALFEKDGDFAAFERVLAEAVGRFAMRLCAYCLMPNHWHLVLWPRGDDELSPFVQWLAMTHSQRWHAHRRTGGRGHVYQGRFKSFPAACDEHLLAVCRYVERNALRANLVARAEDWRWCSLWRWHARPCKPGGGEGAVRSDGHATADGPTLCDWPVERPGDWLAWVNEGETPAELEALRGSCRRGSPFGPRPWAERVAAESGIESSLRPRGRPRKQPIPAVAPAAENNFENTF